MGHMRTEVLFAAILVVACGGEDGKKNSESSTDSGTTAAPLEGCDGIDLAPPEAGKGFQVSVDMMLDPGDERQVCKLVQAPEAVNVNWTEGLYTRGSHHALIARTSFGTAFPDTNVSGMGDPNETVDCEGVAGIPIGAGRAVGDPLELDPLGHKGTLPDDVAFKVAQGEVIEVNFHMHNGTDEPVHACYKANLNGIPDDQVKYAAGVIFYYDQFITVPAMDKATATMACPVSQDVTMIGQISHMHSRGVDYKATLLDGDPLAGGKDVQTLYETKDWEEPVMKINEPYLSLKQGQWIRWTCGYENKENRDVAQGQETTDEMCMFNAVYWPENPLMSWCSSPSGGGPYGAARYFTNGTKDGAYFVECSATTPLAVSGGGPDTAAARYVGQKCLTDTCPNVSARLNEYFLGQVDLKTVGCN